MPDPHIVDDFLPFLPFALNKIKFPLGWNIRAEEERTIQDFTFTPTGCFEI